MMPAKLKISWPGGAWVAVIRLAVWALLGAAAAMSLAMLSTPPANAGSNAVVIMYHRFGETKYPSTNVTLEQFEAHLDELKSGKYTVMPLAEILAAVDEGKPLPDRTVGLSIDDAFFSLYAEGWPRLKAAGFPFTLFIATDPIDQGTFGYMNWDQIREMSRAGVTIGSQTASHLHMPKADPARNREELERSNKRFEEELGRRPLLFAYPYGESSTAVQTVVRETGFKAAFGPHSGALGGGGNLFALPRFAMNENYAGLARFRLAVNALPLPVTDITPADPLIGAVNPPAMGFTVDAAIKNLDQLACFSSNAGKAKLERLGERRVEIRVDQAFPKGRTRINCTLPAGGGRWHWFGRQFYRPE